MDGFVKPRIIRALAYDQNKNCFYLIDTRPCCTMDTRLLERPRTERDYTL